MKEIFDTYSFLCDLYILLKKEYEIKKDFTIKKRMIEINNSILKLDRLIQSL